MYLFATVTNSVLNYITFKIKSKIDVFKSKV